MNTPRNQKNEPTIISGQLIATMPVSSLNRITDRAPCIVDYSFDNETYNIVPLQRTYWWGWYFGKFGTWEPKLGVVFYGQHIRFYLWKYTIILGKVPPQTTDIVVAVQETFNDEILRRERLAERTPIGEWQGVSTSIDPNTIPPGRIEHLPDERLVTDPNDRPANPIS